MAGRKAPTGIGDGGAPLDFFSPVLSRGEEKPACAPIVAQRGFEHQRVERLYVSPLRCQDLFLTFF
jgi:hypothetical protein